MFAFNPGVNDMSGQILGQGVVNAANTRAQAQVQMVDDIGGSLVGLAGMYGQSVDRKDMLKGMDDAVGIMSQNGALPPNFLESWQQSDQRTRPFLFQAIASPMFNAHLSGMKAEQAAMAQQRVWGGGGSGGGGGPTAPGPSTNNKQGYVFGG